MMAPPHEGAALVVVEPQHAFQFLIDSLRAPALFDDPPDFLLAHSPRQGREHELRWLFLAIRPLHHQPHRLALLGVKAIVRAGLAAPRTVNDCRGHGAARETLRLGVPRALRGACRSQPARSRGSVPPEFGHVRGPLSRQQHDRLRAVGKPAASWAADGPCARMYRRAGGSGARGRLDRGRLGPGCRTRGPRASAIGARRVARCSQANPEQLDDLDRPLLSSSA